jgi:hypothetical protein
MRPRQHRKVFDTERTEDTEKQCRLIPAPSEISDVFIRVFIGPDVFAGAIKGEQRIEVISALVGD